MMKRLLAYLLIAVMVMMTFAACNSEGGNSENIILGGKDGKDGTDYILTEADREDIADEVVQKIKGYTEGLEYFLSADGTYYICHGGNVSGDVIIPPEYNGLPVKEIADSAFYGDRRGHFSLTSVVIPNTVEKIDCSAFAEQFNLSSIILKGTPLSIYNDAFATRRNDDYFGVEAVTCDIYVPWSEGEVANAPWGADPEFIHYNSIESKNLRTRVTELEEKVEMLMQGGGGATEVALLTLINEGGLE